MKYEISNKCNSISIGAILSLVLLCFSANVAAQQEMTRAERIKVLQLLKANDTELEKATQTEATDPSGKIINELELPPLSVFWMR